MLSTLPVTPLRVPLPAVEGSSVLYVGTKFSDRGWHPVKSRHFDRGQWWLRLTGIVARETSVRTVLIVSPGPWGRPSLTCSRCGSDGMTASQPCSVCGLRIGAVYDPSRPSEPDILGLPNLACMTGRQAAQEYFPLP